MRCAFNYSLYSINDNSVPLFKPFSERILNTFSRQINK